MVSVSFLSKFFSSKKFVQKRWIDQGNGDVDRELEVASVFPLSLNIYKFSFSFFPLLISGFEWFSTSDFTDVEIGVFRSAILRNLGPFFSTICVKWWNETAKWQKPTFDQFEGERAKYFAAL